MMGAVSRVCGSSWDDKGGDPRGIKLIIVAKLICGRPVDELGAHDAVRWTLRCLGLRRSWSARI